MGLPPTRRLWMIWDSMRIYTSLDDLDSQQVDDVRSAEQQYSFSRLGSMRLPRSYACEGSSPFPECSCLSETSRTPSPFDLVPYFFLLIASFSGSLYTSPCIRCASSSPMSTVKMEDSSSSPCTLPS